MKKTTKTWYWPALALAAGALVYYAQERDLYGQYLMYQEAVRTVEQRGQELTVLKEHEGVVRHHVEGLDSDPLEMEAAIRQSKRLIREGERVYRVRLVDNEEASSYESDSHE